MASPFLHRTGVLIRLLLFLLLWLIGLLLTLTGLLLSPWGSHWAFDQAQSRGWVQAERFEGAPLDELTIDGLQLAAGTLSVSVDHFHLAWADDCLLKGRVCLEDLTVSGARIRLAQGEPATEPEAPAEPGGAMPVISVPLPIEIRQVKLDDVGLELANGTRVHWAHFQTGATLDGHRLTLSPTTLEQTRVTLAKSDDSSLAGTALTDATLGEGVVSPDAIEAAEALTGADRAERSSADALAATAGPATPTAVPHPSYPLMLTPLTLAATANVAAANDDQAQAMVEKIETALREARAQIPDLQLPLEVVIPEVTVSDVTLVGAGPDAQTVNRVELSLQAVDRQIEIQHLLVDAPDGHVEAQASATLEGDLPLSLTVEGRVMRAPIYGQRFNLRVEGTLADLQLGFQTDGNATASFNANLHAFDDGVPFQAHLTTGKVQWPFAERPFAPFGALDDGIDEKAIVASRQLRQVETPAPSTQYRLDHLTLDVEGSLEHYDAKVDLAGQAADLPPVTLAVDGSGDLAHFRWQPLKLAAEGGSLNSQGLVRWTPALSASVNLDFQQLPIGAFTQAVSGTLNGRARAAFAMRDDGGWQLALPQLAIDGRLQQRALDLNAQLEGNSDMQWNIRSLDLRQGQNRVTASGQVGDRLNVDARIDAPALGTLLPQLSGSLNGTIQGRGTLTRPQIDADLRGSQVAYAENRINALSLDAKVSGIDDPQFDVDLTAGGLEAGGQQIDAVDLGLTGKLSQHQLSLDVSGGEGLPLSALRLRLRGGLDSTYQRYQGALSQLSVGTDYGDIALRDSLAFSANLATSSATVQPFCLDRQQGGALCLTERMTASAAQGRAALSIDDIPMALLNDFMPEGWQVDGQTNGNVVASWSRGGQAWTANADLDSQVAVSGVDARGAPWQVPAATLSLSLDANQQRASSQLDLQLQDAGRVRLQATVDDPAGAGALQGRLQLDDLRFAPYRPLVAGINQLEGAINGDVSLGGNIAAPALNGNIRVGGVKVRGDISPVAVTDGQLDLALQGQSSMLDGYVQSDDGRINLSGDANWRDPAQWRANVNIDGTDSPLLVAMPAYGRLRVAPDLQIHAMPQRLQVRGDVSVPWARLEIGQIPSSAQAPSSDTVIITEEEDRQQQAAAAASANEEGADTAQALADAGMQLDVRVNLHLGPDMQLKAYGLEAGLKGELQVRQGTGPVQLYGDVNLVDGTYTSFGQDLIIRQGQVLFSGPASQPSLQFEAIRNPDTTEDDVVAGLRVTGSASAPRLTIFSEPAMTESRALSYILRGRAPEDSGGGDDALTSALIGLSLSQTGSAVGQVGEAFGVQDLSLDASGSGDDSQVVVSGYVFDDLKVSYGVGIFSPIAELTLRYRLIQNLYLQAVSGASQALDLIYTFSLGRTSGP
ncbi:autotransporter assembly complex protein TamB [Salinicola rhizosphaerae]|uniref:Translocation/assembly module TamB n=1 Tax=Salinicola rhizosphaerae TaxID=1443141 RepID=A0ABQ3DSE5_9GAMM|nr:translocation/assembly module TamB domain-containing protein [Salinicola rhizosphaerae]GHB09296.1 translocation/assembly module TamB [Salinicola rhizosphaerae]